MNHYCSLNFNINSPQKISRIYLTVLFEKEEVPIEEDLSMGDNMSIEEDDQIEEVISMMDNMSIEDDAPIEEVTNIEVNTPPIVEVTNIEVTNIEDDTPIEDNTPIEEVTNIEVNTPPIVEVTNIEDDAPIEEVIHPVQVLGCINRVNYKRYINICNPHLNLNKYNFVRARVCYCKINEHEYQLKSIREIYYLLIKVTYLKNKIQDLFFMTKLVVKMKGCHLFNKNMNTWGRKYLRDCDITVYTTRHINQYVQEIIELVLLCELRAKLVFQLENNLILNLFTGY